MNSGSEEDGLFSNLRVIKDRSKGYSPRRPGLTGSIYYPTAGIFDVVTSALTLHPLDVINFQFVMNGARMATALGYRGLTGVFLLCSVKGPSMTL